MKKIILALLVCFVGFSTFAQDGKEKQAMAMELMKQKVPMQVNMDLFTQITPNTYVSEKPKAVIMAMMVPETLENAEKTMNSSASKDFKVEETGKTTVDGQSALFMKGTSNKDGVTIQANLYALKYKDDVTVMFVGMYEEGASEEYQKAIDIALKSVAKFVKK